jgi:hypothetical protein
MEVIYTTSVSVLGIPPVQKYINFRLKETRETTYPNAGNLPVFLEGV